MSQLNGNVHIVAIVDLVRSGSDGDNRPFRPSKEGLLSDEMINEQIHRCLTSLMDECWTERAHVRPSFDVCLELIYRLTGNKSVCCVSAVCGLTVCASETVSLRPVLLAVRRHGNVLVLINEVNIH